MTKKHPWITSHQKYHLSPYHISHQSQSTSTVPGLHEYDKQPLQICLHLPPQSSTFSTLKLMGVTKMHSWVQMQSLLGEKFFNACLQHPEEKKNEMNLFCLDCCKAICTHCSPHHISHNFLQIRKYMYNYVLRLEDARKLMSCSQVQTYTSNTEKVVYLKRRTQPKPSRNTKCCSVCQKGIQQNFEYCSFYCKLEFLQRSGQLQWDEPGPGGMLTRDSVLEPVGSGTVEGEVVRRRRSGVDSCRPVVSTPESTGSMISRRKKKSTPFRAPLC